MGLHVIPEKRNRSVPFQESEIKGSQKMGFLPIKTMGDIRTCPFSHQVKNKILGSFERKLLSGSQHSISLISSC